MIRACFVPYASGYAGLVIADDSTDPPRVVLAQTWPVGRLVPVPDAIEGQPDKRREVSPGDIQTIAGIAVGALTHAGARSVTIERSDSPIQTQIGQALERRCSDIGIETRTIAADAWRRLAGSRVELAPLCARSFAGWPILRLGAGLLAWAGALWLACRPSPVDALAVNVEGGNHGEVSADQLLVRPSVWEQCLPSARVEVRADAPELGEPVRREARGDSGELRALPVAGRDAGYDPGSAHPALVIAEGSTLPLRLVCKPVTLAAGGMVLRAKPIRRTRVDADGTERTWIETHRRSVTADHVDAHASEVLALLLAHGVKRLFVEHVEHVRLEGLKAGLASAIATALNQARWLEAVVIERCRVAGIKVIMVTRQQWVSRVVKRVKGAKGPEQEAQILPSIQAGFSNWPDESDNHQRDAGGVLLYSFTPIPDNRRKRKPREPRLRVVTGPTKEQLAECAERVRLAKEKRAKRAAKDERCTCPPGKGRHRRECPCAPPAKARGFDVYLARREAMAVTSS